MKKVFLYNDKFSDVSYGSSHPMRPERLGLTYGLIKKHELLNPEKTALVEARKATESEVLLFHTKEYVEALKIADTGSVEELGKEAVKFGLGYCDNPAFKGVYEWSRYVTGASVQASEMVAAGEADAAFNIGGGLHHAIAGKASGFCYIDDPVVAIKRLLHLNKRVAYVDIDAHHGDGVEAAFYDTDKVLTISIHESGFYLFPGTGFPENMGEGRGKGYAVNLPMPPSTGDELFVHGFNEIVPPALKAFKPDILVTQLGVDTFHSDPITHINLTTNGFEEMVRAFKGLGIPWVALGGGGYNMDNVKRAWTLAWAIMAGEDGEELDVLRDAPLRQSVSAREEREAEAAIKFLRENVLPLIKSS